MRYVYLILHALYPLIASVYLQYLAYYTRTLLAKRIPLKGIKLS